MSVSRREFVRSAAGLAAMGLGGTSVRAAMSAENSSTTRRPDHPIVIASANGSSACNRAMELLRQGADPVDAVVAGVNLVEDDPTDHSVGYGGLPNEDGIVELDACVMHGPTHKGGGVAALRDIRHPSSVAKLVMQRTDHVLLVGEGAKRFAVAHGFKEENLLTDEARQIWLRWREMHSDRDDWIHPEADVEAARQCGEEMPEFTYGTITCIAATAAGDLGGCTTTSGLAYKIPGRVGDSPILGAGLYVDNEVGACGSTGRGEANLINCSCFMVVQLMQAGASPEEACQQVLQRIAQRTEPRLRDAEGLPNYDLRFYALRRDGLVGGAALRGDWSMTVHDAAACRSVPIKGIYPDLPRREKRQTRPR